MLCCQLYLRIFIFTCFVSKIFFVAEMIFNNTVMTGISCFIFFYGTSRIRLGSKILREKENNFRQMIYQTKSMKNIYEIIGFYFLLRKTLY